MYFYITEYLTTPSERRRIEEIKSLLSQLGIAGEFVVASPAKTVEDHLEMAFRKGFTTIVGIGSDALANRLAATIFRFDPERSVMGMIPLQPQQQLWSMIAAKTTKEAVESLRQRRLEKIHLLDLGRQQAIITAAAIHLNQAVRFELVVGQAILSGQFTDLLMRLSGRIILFDKSQINQPIWNRFIGRSTTDPLAISRLTANRWRLSTETPCDVTVDGLVVTQTPLDVKRRPRVLKLIVNRARISPVKTYIDAEE